jgi:phosphopantetheine--protein transferase-like protein
LLLGVDLLAMNELDKLLTRSWFREYVYTAEELATADELGESRRREFLVGRFAAKEAIVKALGRGYGGGVAPRQAAVLRAESGAPRIQLFGALAHAANELGVAELDVSISHKTGFVIAVAVGRVRARPSAARIESGQPGIVAQ